MATSATPYGARPINTTSASGSFTGKVQHIKIASAYGTAIFYGDFVKLVTAGTIEKDTGTTACTPIGIFLGCKYTDPSTNQMTFNQTWPASTAASDADGPRCELCCHSDSRFDDYRKQQERCRCIDSRYHKHAADSAR